jgi:ATP-binding cassette subfamily B protein
MNYTLSTTESGERKDGVFAALRKLWPLMAEDKGKLFIAFLAILLSSGLTVLAPIMIGHAVDTYIAGRDLHGLGLYSLLILAVYAASAATSFLQTRVMGAVGQGLLLRLRGTLFNRLQELPVAFFNQNKAGDLISRINNDTDKLNQFFSRSLMQFVGNIFVIIGAAIAMLTTNHRLGGAALLPAVALLIFAQAVSGWIKRKNFRSLQTLGGLSGEIQESLENFRVIIAFNRRDYFQKRFEEVNEGNYQAAVSAGIANNTYVPVFGFASNLGTMIVITYGLHLISVGALSFGLLISYLSYVTRFYDPLRQMAQLWSDLQTALAGWDRISEIMAMRSDLAVVAGVEAGDKDSVLEFKNVAFRYPNGKEVLKDINFRMEPGKTYALVGPTGGGKTTTASLIARLYDPSEGTVFLNGKDIRSYEADVRTQKIGFILQDPFLFSGTVGENILYGNGQYKGASNKKLGEILKAEGLEGLLARFDQGLETPVSSSGESISLGQKQLIAFIRAVLRHPDLIILDEATANIDTVTEQLLDEVLQRLPKTTARVVIAHRLNTIANADQIFFVNGGTVTPAGSLDDAVAMLAHGARTS